MSAWVYDIAAGTVTKDGSAVNNINRVVFNHQNVGGTKTAQIAVEVHDTGADTVVLNQAPAVLTSIAQFGGVKSSKVLRSKAGDTIDLKSGATDIATYNADSVAPPDFVNV